MVEKQNPRERNNKGSRENIRKHQQQHANMPFNAACVCLLDGERRRDENHFGRNAPPSVSTRYRLEFSIVLRKARAEQQKYFHSSCSLLQAVLDCVEKFFGF